MEDAEKTIKTASASLSGYLVVGNHDTVTLLGMAPQNEVGNCSRKMAAMLASDTHGLDKSIEDTVSRLKDAGKQKRGRRWFRMRGKRDSDFGAEGSGQSGEIVGEALSCLKLQQARLIKEEKVLKKMGKSLSECVSSLDCCIEEGNRILAERNTDSDRGDDDEIDLWYSRLERRIADLQTSRVLALQSEAQIKILRKNDFALIDRASAAISSLSLLYQGQIAIGQGIDLLNESIEQQRIVSDAIGNADGRG